MAETAWTEDEPPPRKKSVPTWLWVCGSGCLALVILAVVAIGFGVAFFKKATDPETQWPKLAKTLPYDERPPEMHLIIGNQLGMELYQILDDRGFQLQVQHHTGKEGGDARQKLFGTDHPEFPMNFGVMKFENVAAGTIEIQGRTLRVIRMKMGGMLKSVAPKDAQESIGDMLWVDLTPEGDPGMLLLNIQRMKGEGQRMKGEGPITDEEVRDLLKPFHIGPNR